MMWETSAVDLGGGLSSSETLSTETMVMSSEVVVLTEGARWDMDLGVFAFFEARGVLSEALRFAWPLRLVRSRGIGRVYGKNVFLGGIAAGDEKNEDANKVLILTVCKKVGYDPRTLVKREFPY